MSKVYAFPSAKWRSKDVPKMNKLSRACFRGRLKDVKRLLENKYFNANEEPSLSYAIQGGNFHVLKYLVEHGGADIHRFNEITLEWAVALGNFDCVKFLVENGAYLHIEDDKFARMAFNYRNPKILNYLRQVAGDKWRCHECLVKMVCNTLCYNWNKTEDY